MRVREVAINFIRMLSPMDRKNLKAMLEHGITCGSDYADNHNVDVIQFNEELKSIFKGE